MDTFTKDGSSGSRGSSKTVDKFAYADGRRYHNEPNCPYPLPNDLGEIDRLELQHYMIQQVTQKRYHAPIDSPKRAIDIATGTGIWMMEMATDFPECEFTGIDIAPLQPTAVLPRNCTFKLANVLEGLSDPDGYFDYVRHSLLVAAIPKEKWVPFVKECTRLCASGGWVEMVEFNCRVYEGGAVTERFSDILGDSLRAQGLSPETTEILDDLMRQAGLVDVQVKRFKLPFGKWGGTAGEIFVKDARMLHTALAPLYAKKFGMSVEDVEKLVQDLEDESNHYQAYSDFRIYIGRKP
ncbi:S-adenosyl-L-methionine-dependent methyltransferase [Thamnocephalis sphaerospora]|uniref:S-adenosyl-L-methionine-dependent methyltransferase n=1 Tax=Thamnocephalis sphaerospora TaxID=78915 RepID=A0A4P9XSG3_9FUNG|nr:S-adenosyl-L-methionine-dependent methyltransferase [Thamnocephalis sphaerospora]|eukprot:RKP08290.1 S-adenosyl-L-methionine-dependent methyltransferase [Thamnocephalis sphaerospora]